MKKCIEKLKTCLKYCYLKVKKNKILQRPKRLNLLAFPTLQYRCMYSKTSCDFGPKAIYIFIQIVETTY